MGLMSEFKEFLFEYKVIPLAIALIWVSHPQLS